MITGTSQKKDGKMAIWRYGFGDNATPAYIESQIEVIRGAGNFLQWFFRLSGCSAACLTLPTFVIIDPLL